MASLKNGGGASVWYADQKAEKRRSEVTLACPYATGFMVQMSESILQRAPGIVLHVFLGKEGDDAEPEGGHGPYCDSHLAVLVTEV